MSTCAKCGTPVYFAERRTSLGKDWHPGCLTCFECGKRLHPGQHAEHRHRPYCHNPCYSLLFGPTNFRHGVGVVTGQESPETRRRMLGERKLDATLVPEKQQTRSPLTGVSIGEDRSFSDPPRPSGGRDKLEDVSAKNGKENWSKSPAGLAFSANSIAAASPQSSPSRSRCRKRLYDAELACNLPKDITKDQLFRSIQTFNEYYTSPTSSGFLGNSDGSVGQNWKFLIDYKERNGKFILECMLKIRWGVKRYIQFLERDDVDPVVWRRSYLARLADSETPMLQLLQRDSYKKRQSFQSVINHSTLSVRSDGSGCKSPKKEAKQLNGNQPNDSIKPSRSFYDNVPSMRTMLEDGANLLADDDDDDRKRSSKGRRSPSSSSSSAASSPTSSRSTSPRRSSRSSSRSSSIDKQSRQKIAKSTSTKRQLPAKIKSTTTTSSSSKPSKSFNRNNQISSHHESHKNNHLGSQSFSNDHSDLVYSYNTEVYKTALTQFSPKQHRPTVLANNSCDVALSEDEGFHTGVPDDDIYYTSRSEFFNAEKNNFSTHRRDAAVVAPMSQSRSFVSQLCSPDKRLTDKTNQRSASGLPTLASSTPLDRSRHSCSLPRRGSATGMRTTTKNFGGEPAADLKAESEKWRREAERWRSKLEEQSRNEESSIGDEKVTLRQSRRSRLKKARPPSINGHVYNPRTRVFMPEFDTISTVRVDNMLKANDVIQILLSKFRIENDPKEFMLYVVKSNGETFAIDDDDFPLYVRLKLGPCHDESQFYLMERNSIETIPAEVATLMSLPMPVLERMQWELQQRQEEEEKLLKSKIAAYRNAILEMLRKKNPERPLNY